MTRHISTEVLARYRGGDLSERRSRRVRAHLAGCHRCAATSSGLAEVSQLLRAATGPRRPEPARRAGWPALRSPVALRVLAGTAAAAVIAGGAYTAGQLTGGGSSAGTASSAAGSRPDASRSSDAPLIQRSGAAVPEASPGAAGAASSGMSSAASSAAGPTLTYQAAHGAVAFVPVAAGADLRRQGLAGAVGKLLLGTGHRTPLGTPPGTSTPRLFSGIPVTALEGCVSRVAAGGQVRLVDVDHYQGSKATIIVVAPAGGGRQQIWVVGPGCSRSDPKVITRTTLPSAG
jgi:Putative zinc-finger